MPGPATQPHSRLGHILRLVALYGLTPLLLILEVPVAVHIAQKPATGMAVHNLVVQHVTPGDPADQAGVLPGDKIIAINGQAVGTMVGWYLAEAGHYELEPRNLLLQRDNGLVDVIIHPRRPNSSQVIRGNGMSLAGIAFLAMGWLVFSRRHDMVTRYFFGLCATFAFFLMDVPDWPSATYMTIKDIIRDFAHLLLPVTFFRFFLYFPERTHLTPRNHARHRLLWLPAVPLFIASLYIQATRPDPGSSFVAIIQQISTLFFLSYLIAGLIVFARKILRRDQPVVHSKLRIVLLGLFVGFLPFMLGAVISNTSLGPKWDWAPWLAFSLALVPVSFGVAILRYGALGISDLMRHGLVYLLLSVTIISGYGILVGIIGHALTGYFRTGEEPMIISAVIVTALVLNPLRRRLHSWIDATFYPARRATREAILSLGHELSALIEDSETLNMMLQRLHDLYRPLHVGLFLEDHGAQTLHAIHSDTELPSGPYRLDAEATLLRVLKTAHRPIATEELSGLDTMAATDAQTSIVLETLGVSMVVPLITGSRLVGFLTMGPKSSGGLYTQADMRNLHDFSVQAAALVEIGRLYQDSLEQERLETELAVATRIQQHLVPTEPLLTPGADILGRMEPCREVGGDSFGYFALDPDTIGFAVADAAGKGIPAALVMTTLSAAFRSAAHTIPEPELVIETLNKHVCSLASTGQFICFFYGTYHTPTRTLRYSNAGMNPPLLVRQGQKWLERLKKGGLVLGIDEDRHYARGSMVLEPGDLLVMYTDGLTEETNAEGEFFGERRLEETVQLSSQLPLEELRDRIFATLNDFGGPDQADDRTLMLMRTNLLP